MSKHQSTVHSYIGRDGRGGRGGRGGRAGRGGRDGGRGGRGDGGGNKQSHAVKAQAMAVSALAVL